MSDESVFRIEPTRLDLISEKTGNLIADIVSASTGLTQALAPETADSLAREVRVMNCYYSNLIEGHNTRLNEIEAALANSLAQDSARRSLQTEALAHIRLQGYIDGAHDAGSLPEPASEDFIRDLHRRFYIGATESMLRIGKPPKDFLMLPGKFRSQPHQDNAVGLHQPPSSVSVAAFMKYFAERYRLAESGTAARILAMATAHHRFNYIHPFDDGNGRVSRLMSHAMGLQAGIGARGLWSISRGLARGLEGPGDYKRWMDHADMPRQGDLDGRGNLSLRALTEFVEWFLAVMLDQIRFMTKLFDLENLGARYDAFVASQLMLKPAAAIVLRDILKRGKLARGEVARVTGLPERTARDVTHALVAADLVSSSTPKGPLALHFSRASIPALFPDLYTRQALS
jgi:Fic family protein